MLVVSKILFSIFLYLNLLLTRESFFPHTKCPPTYKKNFLKENGHNLEKFLFSRVNPH